MTLKLKVNRQAQLNASRNFDKVKINRCSLDSEFVDNLEMNEFSRMLVKVME